MFTSLFQSVFVILLSVWNYFSAFNVPGTSFTPAEWLLGLLVIGLSIKLLRLITGGSYSRPDDGGKRNISNERKGDQF